MNYQEIKSFEDACKALNMSSKLPDVSDCIESMRKSVLSHYQLMIIAQALNDGRTPDWTDYDQWKYYPWFEMGPADGSGFSFYCVGLCSNSCLGSRLCFKSEEIAEYAGTQFTDLYRDYFLAL